MFYEQELPPSLSCTELMKVNVTIQIRIIYVRQISCFLALLLVEYCVEYSSDIFIQNYEKQTVINSLVRIEFDTLRLFSSLHFVIYKLHIMYSFEV